MPKIPQYPILVEDYPTGYTGPPFLTLIEYENECYLTVVDFVTNASVSAYVLDLCKSEGLDDVMIVSFIAIS